MGEHSIAEFKPQILSISLTANHRCLQEMKLNTLYKPSLDQVSTFLLKLSQLLGLSAYASVYLRDYPEMAESAWYSAPSLCIGK